MFTSRTVTLRLPVNKNDNSNIFRRLPMFQSSVIFGILTGSKLLGIEILNLVIYAGCEGGDIAEKIQKSRYC